jgi:peroxiredoxin
VTTQSFAEILEACTRRRREMDAPLADRLNALANDVRNLDPSFAEIVDRMVSRLQQINAGTSAPSVGDPMPLFVLPDEAGRLVALAQLLERGPVVISFHRGHWCPYCRISADALAKIEPEVRAASAQIVAITPEVQRFTSELKSDARATFPVLSDLDSGYALELQLAIKIDEEKRVAMTRAGWDISAFQDNENWTLPIPATFVVGADGSVKARFVDPDYRKRMDVDDILAALRTRYNT